MVQTAAVGSRLDLEALLLDTERKDRRRVDQFDRNFASSVVGGAGVTVNE